MIRPFSLDHTTICNSEVPSAQCLLFHYYQVFFASDRLGDETGPAQYIRTFAIDLSSGQTREINTSIPLINGAASFGNGIAIAAQVYCFPPQRTS